MGNESDPTNTLSSGSSVPPADAVDEVMADEGQDQSFEDPDDVDKLIHQQERIAEASAKINYRVGDNHLLPQSETGLAKYCELIPAELSRTRRVLFGKDSINSPIPVSYKCIHFILVFIHVDNFNIDFGVF